MMDSKSSGSPIETEEFTFKSKDGLYYGSYNDYVAANVRYNEKVLKDKGLEEVWSKSRNGSTRKRVSVVVIKSQQDDDDEVLVQPRRSSRLQVKTTTTPDNVDQIVSNTDIDIDEVERKLKRKRPSIISTTNSSGGNNNTVRVSKKQSVYIQPLTVEERLMLKDVPTDVWVSALSDYLDTIEQISIPNRRNVMNQVKKLCSGNGVSYRHWPSTVYFYLNECIDLSTNFIDLYSDAVDYENKYGRDLGNGWLLRHPITKLINFQAYYFETIKKDKNIESSM